MVSPSKLSSHTNQAVILAASALMLVSTISHYGEKEAKIGVDVDPVTVNRDRLPTRWLFCNGSSVNNASKDTSC